jgi:Transcriptional activator of glycolytic enzymes
LAVFFGTPECHREITTHPENGLIALDFPKLPPFNHPLFSHPLWPDFAVAVQRAHFANVETHDTPGLLRHYPEMVEAISTRHTASITQFRTHADEIRSNNALLRAEQEKISGPTKRVLELVARNNQILQGMVNGKVTFTSHSHFGRCGDHCRDAGDAGSIAPTPVAAFEASALASALGSSAPLPLAPLDSTTTSASYQSPYSSTLKGPNEYQFNDHVKSVQDCWREWKEGIAGGPSIESLELRFSHSWRPSSKARTLFCRRRVIWEEIQRLIDSGLAVEAVLEGLEAKRGGRSLHKLYELLREEREGRVVKKRKRKGLEADSADVG